MGLFRRKTQAKVKEVVEKTTVNVVQTAKKTAMAVVNNDIHSMLDTTKTARRLLRLGGYFGYSNIMSSRAERDRKLKEGQEAFARMVSLFEEDYWREKREGN